MGDGCGKTSYGSKLFTLDQRRFFTFPLCDVLPLDDYSPDAADFVNIGHMRDAEHALVVADPNPVLKKLRFSPKRSKEVSSYVVSGLPSQHFIDGLAQNFTGRFPKPPS